MDRWATEDAINDTKGGPLEYVLLGLSKTVPCLPWDVYERTGSLAFNKAVARPFFEHRLLDVMLTYANVQGPRQDSQTKRILPDPVIVKKILDKDAMRPVSVSRPQFCASCTYLEQLLRHCLENWPVAVNLLFGSGKSSNTRFLMGADNTVEDNALMGGGLSANVPGASFVPSTTVVSLAHSRVREIERHISAYTRDLKMIYGVVINNFEIAASALSYIVDVST